MATIDSRGIVDDGTPRLVVTGDATLDSLTVTHNVSIGGIFSSPGVAATGVASIAALRLLNSAPSGQYVVLEGYYAPGDGGGGQFYWDAASTVADNGGTVIQATGVVTGRWTRLDRTVFNVRWFGAKGDGVTDDSAAIQATLDVAGAAGGGTVLFPDVGPYLHHSTLVIPLYIVFKGVNKGFGSPGSGTVLVKDTVGDGIITCNFLNEQAGSSVSLRDLGISNTYCSTINPWQAGHTYAVNDVVRPSGSLANGPNTQVVSPRFLKCTAITTGIAGTYQPIGTLYASNGYQPTRQPDIKLTGTPANDKPIDIQLLSSGSFSWSDDRFTTSHTLAIAPAVVLGASGYTANFTVTNYGGQQPLYRTPSFKWSLKVGDVIVDNGVTWTVIDAGAGVTDNFGANWSIENCMVGVGYNIGLILDGTEDFFAKACTFGGGGKLGAWLVNGGEHNFGVTVGGSEIQNTNGIVFEECVFFGQVGMVDDGGITHSFTMCDLEGSIGVAMCGVLGGVLNACYTEGNSSIQFNNASYFGVVTGASVGIKVCAMNLGGTHPIDARGFLAPGNISVACLSIEACFCGSPITLVHGAGNVQGLSISCVTGPGPDVPMCDAIPYSSVIYDARINADGTSGSAGFGGLSLGSVASPQNTLDILGGVSLRERALGLSNGANHNVSLAGNGIFVPTSMGRIVGPTGPFGMTGMGVRNNDLSYSTPPGATTTLVNPTGQPFTLFHENTGSVPQNRFTCPHSVDILLPSGNYNAASCWYDQTTSRWFILSTSS
jgi:hypothetical protein